MISQCLIASSMLALANGFAIDQVREEYSPQAGKFSIRFPGKPKESNQTTKSPIGEVKVFTATYATSDGNVYMVSYSDLPMGATKPENHDTFFDGIKEGLRGKEWKINNDKKIEFGTDKLPGREIELEKEKVSQRAKFRVILRDNRLYQTAVVGTPSFIRSEDAKMFLESFELTK